MELSLCIHVLKRVIKQHESLTACFHDTQLTAEQKALCYGVIRWYLQLKFILNQLLHKPLKDKNLPVTLSLYIGLFQIIYGDMPNYAIVKEVVNHIKQSKFHWATALTNKVLRQFIDNQDAIMQIVQTNAVARFAHPQWMIDLLDEKTLTANNQPAPMTLRVNLQKITRDAYLKKLAQAGIDAIELASSDTAVQLTKALPVSQLPEFDSGLCSIQDEAGQLIAHQLKLKPGMRVLDACCAPGSKTCHIVETETNLKKLVAIDVDEKRLKKVSDNLNRLQLNTEIVSLIAADANATTAWWDNKRFERILIDAPCSGSGVIRRHPDIKLLRRATDIPALQQRQLCLLRNLSPLLTEDGLLIYSTCSAFHAENSDVINAFIKKSHFKLIDEQQLFPEKNAHDGFYIAVLKIS